MKISRIPFLIFACVLSFYTFSNAQDDQEAPGSFIAIEAGPMYVLSNVGPAVKDPFVIYFNLGFTMKNLFGKTLENRNFTMGPRVGLSFGQSNIAGSDTTLFYDVIGNFRYTPGNGEQTFRPYIEGGPGVGNYTGAAVHVDAGVGLDIFFDHDDAFGLSAHYNEYFTAAIERSVTFLASLSHHW